MNTIFSRVACVICVTAWCAGCSGGPEAAIAKAEKDLAGKQLTFAADIQPIVAARCKKCHVDETKSKLSLATLEDAMKGGKKGIDIVPGDAEKSPMYQMVAGLDPKIKKMPPKGDPLTPVQIATIKLWISGGAK